MEVKMAFNYEVTTSNLSDSLSLGEIESVIIQSITSSNASSVVFQGVSALSQISSNANIAELDAGGIINVNAVPSGLAALVISGESAAVVTITDPGFDGTVVLNNSANNQVTVQTAQNVAIQGGSGSDTIVTAAGTDTVVTGAGNDSVSTGSGGDKVIVSASATDKDTINTGTGVDRIEISGVLSASDVSNGAVARKQSNDLSVSAADSGITVTTQGNDLVMSLPSGQTVTIKNGEIIEFEDGTAIAVANNNLEGAMLRLYKGFIGRDMDADGAAWWLDYLRDNPQKTIQDVVRAFANEAETKPIMNAGTNSAFLDALYTQAFGRSADTAGKQYWLDQLATGGKSRVDVVASFMWSTESEAKIVGVIEIDGNSST
jgi:hypothetical protein